MPSKKLAILAALSMITASGAAVAQSAAPPSAVAAPAMRAGAEVEDASELRGGYLVPLVVVVAIMLAIYFVLGNDDSSASP